MNNAIAERETKMDIGTTTVEYMTEEKYERGTLDKYKREQKDVAYDFDVKLSKNDLQKIDKMETKHEVHRYIKTLIDAHLDAIEQRDAEKKRMMKTKNAG